MFSMLEERAPGQLYLADLNHAAARLVGATREEAIGRGVFELWPRERSTMLAHNLSRCLESGEVIRYQARIGLPDGRRELDIHLIPLERSGEDLRRILVHALDLTEQRHQSRQLNTLERVYRTAVENSPDTIARYDQQCRRIYANGAFVRVSGRSMSDLLGKTPLEVPGGPTADAYQRAIKTVLYSGEPTDFELKWRDGEGDELCTLISLTPERDGQGTVVSVLAVGRDITDIESYRRQLHHLSNFDTLSGLPNRDQFYRRLQQMMADADAHQGRVGMMLLDLDRFRIINDSLGHSIGDALLYEMAIRLLQHTEESGFVARLGGDEFALLIADIDGRQEMSDRAKALQSLVARPCRVEEHELVLSASIGIAVYPDDGRAVDDLLKFADSALHHVKENGRDGFRFYDQWLTVGLTERMLLETELRTATQRTELEVYYQPKIDLRYGRVLGCEALVRWNNPRRGLLAPDSFISIAEETGTIVEMGDWVLRTACAAAVRWNQGGAQRFTVAVNLSARQFVGQDLVGTVQKILLETGCRPQWIELEITESLLLDDRTETRQTLDDLHALGLKIAIDDFGTGYSALSYLARFPIDVLKIDRAFVQGVEQDSKQEKLLRGIVGLACSLEIELVAEGVENSRQADYLIELGCPTGQGYLFARPMPEADLLTWLARYRNWPDQEPGAI
ncbi:EAL domain-containing protein [Marinobacterium sp. D7]|uniref:putative bifunctional diguanylate cyclase/phosphodiesterase n=1 Tax=Marinobacterium ramblicola TaxID=2849041 RepID=UPI001C2D8D5B|nr:bifunctional diguanylate cyclase/phosphodiesterase [Marinobacterium ramblicola]MBV1787366.1 EAL domain-containing protein [Marinobacterium ramblicola]